MSIRSLATSTARHRSLSPSVHDQIGHFLRIELAGPIVEHFHVLDEILLLLPIAEIEHSQVLAFVALRPSILLIERNEKAGFFGDTVVSVR